MAVTSSAMTSPSIDGRPIIHLASCPRKASMTRRVLAVLLAVSAAALSAQQPAPAPQSTEAPPVVFRAEVNYVEIDALVTDAQGNIVSNLSADDFELVEDGKPQKVVAFSLVNIPIER